MTVRSYIPATDADREAMLQRIGVASVDELFSHILAGPAGGPVSLPNQGLFLPEPLSELELVREVSALAAENRPAGSGAFFRGGGAYRRFTPAVVDAILRRGEFATCYTPYQPEVSQGTLQTVF